MKWEIQYTLHEDELYFKLLKDGWEPYAVVSGDRLFFHFFRRPIEETNE